jgi:hypothetical protein
MKRGFFILTSLIVFTAGVLPVTARDTDPRVEKRKTHSKTYALSGNDKVSLNNQFGEMKINTWEKNEIKVDVTIIAKASTDEIAQKILDKITIEDGKNAGGVYFKTNFKNQKENWEKSDKKEYKEQGMQIDYVVFMPATNPLEATNQFGEMIVPDYRGPLELECKFGSLTAGKLSNVKEVLVEFGSARIESINNGRLTVKFSSADVKKLNGDVETRVEFCEKIKLVIDNNMKQLDIKSSYSTLFLDVSNNFSANFDIKTSFGELDNKSSFSIREEKDDDDDRRGPRFDKQYNGTAGSGSSKVKVKSEFGEVVIGHNLDVDFSEKKSKKKGKVI